jgi:hypothetical protein
VFPVSGRMNAGTGSPRLRSRAAPEWSGFTSNRRRFATLRAAAVLIGQHPGVRKSGAAPRGTPSLRQGAGPGPETTDLTRGKSGAGCWEVEPVGASSEIVHRRADSGSKQAAFVRPVSDFASPKLKPAFLLSDSALLLSDAAPLWSDSAFER